MPLLTRPSRRRARLLPAVLGAATPTTLGAARAGLGVVMIARPTLFPRLMGLDSATSTRVAWLTRMLGAREVAVGLGSVQAVRAGDTGALRTWLKAGALCDAVDAVAVAGALGRGRVDRLPGAALVATASAAVAVQVAAASRG